jgi:S1-C subfamily serine protease
MAVAPRENLPEEAAEPDNADYIEVTVELPARGEPLAWSGRGHGPGCPQTQVSAVLGIAIGDPHGVVVSRVIPDGPAADAGILPGDGIVKSGGVEVTCPSKLLPHLGREEERRSVELTVRRPVETGEAAEPAESAEAADTESPPE